MICSNCGTELNEGTIYCHVCGAQQGTGRPAQGQNSRRASNMQGNYQMPPNGQYAQGNYQMPPNVPNMQGNYGGPQNNPNAQWKDR